MIDTSTLLLNKAKEAFILAIEIYNKPTLRYRAEGFVLFMVNAWELMLKAYLIKRDGEDSIYYIDKHGRTITLDNCIRRVFTNTKDPMRLNLEKIIEFRNACTHFVTEEYESLYIPLFQANVLNYSEKLKEFHNIEVSEIIPDNFLTLSTSLSQLSESEIKAKYSNNISERLIEEAQKSRDNFDHPKNSQFAISIDHYYYLTKVATDTATNFRITKNAEDALCIVKHNQDPNLTHPYNAKRMRELLNKRLEAQGIVLKFRDKDAKINQYHFSNLCRYYNVKDDPRLCYQYTRSRDPQYSYSQFALDFIFELLEHNPLKILEGVVPNRENKSQ